MKTCRLALILFLVFAFALSTACAGKPKSAQESDVDVTSETTEGPVETKDDVDITQETTEEAVETEKPEKEEEPEIGEQPELMWQYEYEESIDSIASFGETVATGQYCISYIHHLSDGSLMDALAYQHTVEDMAFSPDGTILGAGLGVYGVEITELTDHAEPQRLGEGGFTSFNSRLAFSPDGLYIATGNREGIVWIWELDGLTQTAALESPDLAEKKYSDKMLLAIDYHPSGKLLAAMHIDGTISIWELEKKEVMQSLQTANHHNMFRFSPTGSEMVCVVSDRGEYLIQILSVEDGEVLRDIVMPKSVRGLSFSPDGSLLAVASYGSPATIWDVASGDLIYTLDQEIEPLEDADYLDNSPHLLTFTDDGGYLAVTSRASKSSGMIELWRLPGAEPIAPPPVDMHMPPPLPGDVLFDTGSSALKQEAFVELEALAEALYDNFSKATITFVGHTDSRGDAQSNLQLSIDRAQAIKDWFQDWADEKGDLEWTLLVDGKGDSELKVQDEDVDGNFLNDAGALNRRVEIEIDA